MKENESIADFSSRISNVINQLKSNGEDYQEKRIVENILRSLPHKYDNLVMTIEEAKDLTILTMDELMGTLKLMSIGSTDLHLLLPKRKNSKLSQIQEEGGEEEMAQVETPEAEAEVMEDKEML